MATITLSGSHPDASSLRLEDDDTVIVEPGAVIGRMGGPFHISGMGLSGITLQIDGTIAGNRWATLFLFEATGSDITVGAGGRVLMARRESTRCRSASTRSSATRARSAATAARR